MRNVYLAQVNNLYGRNCFIPYSVGLLQAYALSNQTIKDNFKFCRFVYLRESIDSVVNNLQNPDVFGISCYIWNWEYSIALAKAVKNAFPNCLLILGGPHVPVRSENFFDAHPYIDLLAHYEGELTFTDVLLERLESNPDYTKIPGLSVNSNLKTVKTPPRARIESLDSLPSPYLTNVFDEIINDPYDFHASQETHRGCPYSCTFCDWGSNIMAKVKMFGTDRLVEEIEWFAKHKIDLLYNCDANYGLFKRDIDLTQKMVDIKSEYGYPRKFRAAYAKNSNETIYTIAKILNDSGMNKGITLSFQSMDDNTLEIIKRKNIKIQDFKNLMSRYRADGIATYSEIIVGLPGETYDTFANGLDLLMSCGQHDSIQVYNCEVLPNSEMNHPEYRKLHDIKTAITPVLFFHGTPSVDPYQEYYELVTSTATLPTEDWIKCNRLAWIIQALHCLPLTQFIAVIFNKYIHLSYRNFYETLLKFADDNPQTLIGQVTAEATKLFRGIPEGRGWGIIDKRFGNIIWPTEEGSFLKLVVDKDRFYSEIRPCIDAMGFLNYGGALDDIFEYQKAIVADPYQQSKFTLRLNHNIVDYVASALSNGSLPMAGIPLRADGVASWTHVITPDKTFDGDLETYAREVVWYGRKGGKFKHTKVTDV